MEGRSQVQGGGVGWSSSSSSSSRRVLLGGEEEWREGRWAACEVSWWKYACAGAEGGNVGQGKLGRAADSGARSVDNDGRLEGLHVGFSACDLKHGVALLYFPLAGHSRLRHSWRVHCS